MAHAAPPAAVQAQPLPAVTATVTVPPSAAKLRLVGEIEYVQGTGALCVTVTAWPAIVIVPVRAVDPVLASTATLAAPVPVPLAVLSVSHERASLAYHPQLGPVVTVTVPPPPDSVKVSDVEDNE